MATGHGSGTDVGGSADHPRGTAVERHSPGVRGGDPSSNPSSLLASSMLWVALVVVDGFLLLGNLIHQRFNPPYEARDPIFSVWVWNGDLDGSYVEFFGHIQMTFAIVAIYFLWRSRRTAVYGAWVLVLVAIVADDLLKLHERGGRALVGALDLPNVAGIPAQDLGELGIWAALIAVLGPVLAVAHLRATGLDRKNSRTLLLLMGALAFFAVFVDTLHAALLPGFPRFVSAALTLVETAGELGVMTAILVAAHRMAMRSASAAPRFVRTGVTERDRQRQRQ